MINGWIHKIERFHHTYVLIVCDRQFRLRLEILDKRGVGEFLLGWDILFVVCDREFRLRLEILNKRGAKRLLLSWNILFEHLKNKK